MYVFSERTFDISNYSSVISSIAFSKFFNNCLIEPSLIITKSRAKLKVILSENYCNRIFSLIIIEIISHHLTSPKFKVPNGQMWHVVSPWVLIGQNGPIKLPVIFAGDECYHVRLRSFGALYLENRCCVKFSKTKACSFT